MSVFVRLTRQLAACSGLCLLTLANAQASEVRIGLLAGLTGPISAMAPAMTEATRLAVTHVNEQGGIADGQRLRLVVGDSACSPQNATDAATKAVNIDGVAGIVGPSCSGAVLAVAGSVTVPANTVLITPSATSSQVSALDDRDLVFRTVASDDYQGRALARGLYEHGPEREVAVTYLSNDYGQGLAEAFREEFEQLGGTLTHYAAHDGGKASYRSELSRLARSGADTLVVFDYGDGSGLTLVRQALENGFFERFVGADGMQSDALIRAIGGEHLGDFLISAPVGDTSQALERFRAAFSAEGGNPDGIFTTTSYDATFLLALALEHQHHAGGELSASLRAVASAPGQPILPGEWESARELLTAGEDIDYQGAAGSHEFDENGDVPGHYALFGVEGEGFVMLHTLE